MVYDNLNYRAILREAAVRMKKEQSAKTLKWLAEKSEIQAPYLTNVMKERARLNLDQLYALLHLFDWDEDQKQYASLLLEWERSSNPRRRQELKKKIDQTRKAKLQSKAHLKQEVVSQTPEEISRFYLNPFYSLVHAFIGVPRFAEKCNRISQCLNIGGRKLQELMKDLVRLGYLNETKDGYAKTKKNFHLPKESPLCDPYLLLMQQAASQHLQSLPEDEKYGFNATFSANPAARERIHREFLNFLKTIEPIVKESPVEELYGMRFDLFKWSHEKDSV